MGCTNPNFTQSIIIILSEEVLRYSIGVVVSYSTSAIITDLKSICSWKGASLHERVKEKPKKALSMDWRV